MADSEIHNQEDLPMEFETAEDMPLEKGPMPAGRGNVAQENMHRSSAAIIKSYNDDQPILDSYMDLLGEDDPRQLMMKLSAQKSAIDADAHRQVMQQDPGTNELEVLENAQATNELIAETEADATRPSKQVVTALSTPATDPDIAREIEGQLLLLNDIQDMVKDYDGWDIGKDVLLGFLPGKLAWDNETLTGQYLNNEDFMKSLVLNFKGSDIETQLRMWPALKEEIFDALPEGRAISLMTAFLDPTGVQSMSDFNNFWAVLDIADITTLGAGVAFKIASLTKKANAIKVMQDLNNTEKAADVNAAAVMDSTGDVAEAVNIDKVTAHGNAMPFDMTGLDEAATAGLSTETLLRVKAVRSNQAKVAQGIIDEQSFVKESLLSPKSRVAAEAKYTDELTAEGFEDIVKIDEKAGSTRFSYAYVHDGERLEDVGVLNLKMSDETQIFEADTANLLAQAVASPSVTMKGTAKDAADSAVRLDSTTANVGDQLRVLQAQALKVVIGTSGLKAFLPGIKGVFKSPRQKLAELDDVLLTGDSAVDGVTGTRGVVYSVDELKGGVNGVRLDDDQIEAYYNLRGIYDSLFQIRNAEKRKELMDKGNIQVLVSGAATVGRVRETPADAATSLRQAGDKTVWDDVAQKEIPVNDLNLEKMYDQGYVLTKLTDAVQGGDNSYNAVLVMRNSSLSELPQSVMHYKRGYVPKVNKDAYYFAKSSSTVVVNGVSGTNKAAKTHRMFNNKHDADLWVSQQKEPMTVFSDREMESLNPGSSGLGSGGGMYHGARAKNDIPFGLEGKPAERFGAFEALSRDIGSLENYVTRNEWRMGMEQKWINTAKGMGLDVDGFNPQLMPNSEKGNGLRKMGEQIQEWTGMASKDERVWESTVASVLEWGIGKGMRSTSVVTKAMLAAKTFDPIAAARTGAFHLLLGSFTPVQTWVQAQGASVALSLAAKAKDGGTGVLRAVKNQMMLKLAEDNINNPVFLSKLAKTSGMSVDELTEFATVWNRSGLKQSVLQTADYAAAGRGHGITGDAFKRIGEKGLMFYRAGELFNRRTSFSVAFDEFKRANKGKKISDDDLKGIMTRANDFMLNLSKANQAQWQKGVFSLPTQFMQVQFKTMETLFGFNGKFSRGERAKIAMGQLALYGTAGIPLSGMALRIYQEQTGVTQADIEKMNPAKVKLINEGVWGMFFHSTFGADIEVGTRGGAASGMTNFFNDIMFADSTVGEVITGAAGTIPHRLFKQWVRIKPLIQGMDARGDYTDVDDYKIMLSRLAEITSSWSNVQKAHLMAEYDVIQDMNFYPVVTKDFNPATEFMVALGFQPSAQRKVRDLTQINKARDEYRKGVVNSLFSSYWNFTKEVQTAENEREADEIIEKYVMTHEAILGTVTSPEDRKRINASLKLKRDADSKESREIKKYISNFADGQVADYHSMMAQMMAQGLIQLTDDGED